MKQTKNFIVAKKIKRVNKRWQGTYQTRTSEQKPRCQITATTKTKYREGRRVRSGIMLKGEARLKTKRTRSKDLNRRTHPAAYKWARAKSTPTDTQRNSKQVKEYIKSMFCCRIFFLVYFFSRIFHLFPHQSRISWVAHAYHLRIFFFFTMPFFIIRVFCPANAAEFWRHRWTSKIRQNIEGYVFYLPLSSNISTIEMRSRFLAVKS